MQHWACFEVHMINNKSNRSIRIKTPAWYAFHENLKSSNCIHSVNQCVRCPYCSEFYWVFINMNAHWNSALQLATTGHRQRICLNTHLFWVICFMLKNVMLKWLKLCTKILITLIIFKFSVVMAGRWNLRFFLTNAQKLCANPSR